MAKLTILGHRVGAIATEDTEIKLVMIRQMPHTGDEGRLSGKINC